MLHILLMILKVIGILLLIILGVILVLLLCILFVPVRYAFHAEYEERLYVRSHVSWLLHILHFNASYQEKLRWKVRIFGFPVFSERKKKTDKKTDRKKVTNDEMAEEELDQNESDQEVQDQEAQGIKARNTKMQEQLAELTEPTVQTEQTESADKNVKSEETKHKSSLHQKLSRLWKRILAFLKKISGIPRKIRYTIRNIYDKIAEVRENLNYYLELMSSNEFQRGLTLLQKQGYDLWKHIRPAKLQADITFGMEDPAATGQILAIVSMFYPVYGTHVNLNPVFDQSCFQGHIGLKGRIRVFTVLRILAILYDKNLKQIFKQLKKEN